MNVLRPIFDTVLVIMKHELHFFGYTFSYFGIFMVLIGGTLLGIVLRAVFDE